MGVGRRATDGFVDGPDRTDAHASTARPAPPAGRAGGGVRIRYATNNSLRRSVTVRHGRGSRSRDWRGGPGRAGERRTGRTEPREPERADGWDRTETEFPSDLRDAMGWARSDSVRPYRSTPVGPRRSDRVSTRPPQDKPIKSSMASGSSPSSHASHHTLLPSPSRLFNDEIYRKTFSILKESVTPAGEQLSILNESNYITSLQEQLSEGLSGKNIHWKVIPREKCLIPSGGVIANYEDGTVVETSSKKNGRVEMVLCQKVAKNRLVFLFVGVKFAWNVQPLTHESLDTIATKDIACKYYDRRKKCEVKLCILCAWRGEGAGRCLHTEAHCV